MTFATNQEISLGNYNYNSNILTLQSGVSLTGLLLWNQVIVGVGFPVTWHSNLNFCPALAITLLKSIVNFGRSESSTAVWEGNIRINWQNFHYAIVTLIETRKMLYCIKWTVRVKGKKLPVTVSLALVISSPRSLEALHWYSAWSSTKTSSNLSTHSPLLKVMT